jgi:hypothetical protein
MQPQTAGHVCMPGRVLSAKRGANCCENFFGPKRLSPAVQHIPVDLNTSHERTQQGQPTLPRTAEHANYAEQRTRDANDKQRSISSRAGNGMTTNAISEQTDLSLERHRIHEERDQVARAHAAKI